MAGVSAPLSLAVGWLLRATPLLSGTPRVPSTLLVALINCSVVATMGRAEGFMRGRFPGPHLPRVAPVVCRGKCGWAARSSALEGDAQKSTNTSGLFRRGR